MDDLISRRAAIWALDNVRVQRDDSWYTYYQQALDAMSKLPAVQPDHNADVSKKAEGDCISRQAAIEAICKACSMVEDFHKCDYYPETSALLCDELVALRELPPVQPEPHWIPCGERLPEEGQKCLVYDKVIGFRVDTYIGHGNPFNWELFVRDYEAWMPLPNPYKGGETE